MLYSLLINIVEAIMFNFRYALILLPLLLTACQVTKHKNTATIEEQWQLHQQDLKQINAFQVNGSIAHFNENSRSYGRFFIVQKSIDRYELKLTTPVGTNILTLIAEPDYAEVIDKNGKHYTDYNVESLMNKIAKIDVPLNSLHNWLKGFSNDSINDKIDNSGRLASTEFLQQDKKWLLKISNYMTKTFNNKSVDLPAIIELYHDNERVRLKIDNWILR